MKIKIRKITETKIDPGQNDIHTNKAFKVVVSDGCSTTTIGVGFLDLLPAGISHNEVITKRIYKEAAKIDTFEQLPADISITSVELEK